MPPPPKEDILNLALPAEMLGLGELLSAKASFRAPRQPGARPTDQGEALGDALADSLLEKLAKDPACRLFGIRRGMPKDVARIRIKVVGLLGWQSLRMSSDPIDIGELAVAVLDPKQAPTEALLRGRHEIGLMLSEDMVLGSAEGDGPIRKVRLPSRTLEWLSGGKASMGSVTVAKLVGLGALMERMRDNKREPEARRILTPKQLYEGIRARVIGLDEQAKVIAGRLCMHLTRSRLLQAGNDPGTPNECWAIIGAPGVGKTAICDAAGALSGTVFASADASDLTADGYVGVAFSETLRYLIMAAKGDMERARYGFLALDEFMKKARSMGESPVNTVAVQQEALRVISGQVMTVGGRRGWDRPISFNTIGTCFALLGHCPGLDRMIEKRMGRRGMGFNGRPERKTRSWLTDALLDFGLIEELVSRLTAVIVIPPPSMETLLKAVNAQHGIVDSYNRLLESHGAMLFLGDSAVHALAEYGMESGGYFRAMKRAISTLAGEIVFSEQKGTVMVEAADIHRAAAKSDGNAADLLRNGAPG